MLLLRNPTTRRAAFPFSTVFLLIFAIGILADNNAQAQQTHQYTVVAHQPPLLIADAGEDIQSGSGEIITLGGDPVAIGGTPPYTYAWAPETELLDEETDRPQWTTVTEDITFTLTVRDAKGCTASDNVTVVADITTSIAGGESSVAVYPNPAGHWLIIRTGAAGNETLRLMDQNGKVVMKARATPLEHRLDIHSLSNGMYMLMLDNGKKQNVLRIVISR